MRLFLPLLALCLSLSLSAQQVIITGIVDGTAPGGSPRAVELYVNGTIDLGGYALARYSNSNTTETDRTVLPAGTYTDAFVYIVNSNQTSDFASAFGTAGDFSNVIPGTNLFGNGNDAFLLLDPADITIDQTGGVIGNGTDFWEDSWLYRVDDTGPDGGWIVANWINWDANDALDGLTLAEIGAAVPFGTYTTTPPGSATGVTANGNLTEPATNGGFLLTISEAAASDVTITYTLTGSALATIDFTDPSGGSAVITAGRTSVELPINVVDDAESEPVETIVLTVTGVSDATFSTGASATINVFDDEPAALRLISTVQGDGTSSALVGQDVMVEGIVVGDFQGGNGTGLRGFFVQEEDADADADPLTSEGIWIFDNATGTDVATGDLVTITGEVSESDDLTRINATGAGASVVVVSSNNTLPSAAALTLPVASEDDYEALEGMRTTVTAPVTITETDGIARFGEFVVSGGERLIQFTECNAPDPAQLAAYNAAQSLRRLKVDDGRGGSNNFPIILGNGQEVSATNSLRSGSVITGLTGIIDERFNDYRLQGTDFTVGSENARPTAAPSVGGFVKVVGMNVLNYFLTLNRRGANDADEFDRQEAKIVAGIVELDADILGLVEIERLGANGSMALDALTRAITDAGGPTYDYVLNPNPGGDQIMVALIYKSAVVEESGTAANLTVAAGNFNSNRVPLAQTFRIIETGHRNFGQQVTVCVNHWKSKGGSCGAGDDDNGGAGSCNGTRLAAATAILEWLTNDDPTGTGIAEQLVIGDLNAYSQEAPVTIFTDAGWANTVRDNAPAGSFPCGSVPSYEFNNEWGSLDHILASPALAGKVTGATPWTVNAPEPTALDYDTRFNDPALYAPDFYRFSDHDPVVVGLNLGGSLPVSLTSFTGTVNGKVADLSWRTEGEEQTDRFVVERRAAGGGFTEIGYRTAAGNSTTGLNYEYTDEAPAGGANDYRLRMIDQDGTFTYSPVVTLTVQSKTATELRQVAPGRLRLSGAAADSEYVFTNAAGALIRRGTTGENATEINGNDLPAGIYFLLLREPAGGSQTFRVVLR